MTASAMGKIATLRTAKNGVRRCILYAGSDGVYVFPCSSLEDGSATGDRWFEDVASAERFCAEEYGVTQADWVEIADPLPGCQHDWIAPVRVKGRDEGRPQWGALERVDPDGVWRSISRAKGGDAEGIAR